MIPGITNLPVASITLAPRGTVTFRPTSAIFPSRMSTEPFSIVPLATVRIVAF